MSTLITRHGLVWEIDADPDAVHQFVNGDYAVVGEFTLLSVRAKDANPDVGSMLNPSATRRAQGFFPIPWDNQSSPYLAYDATLSLKLPHRVVPGDSVVSATRMPAGSTPYVKHAAVLTCTSAPPDPKDFRPSYAGGQRVKANAANLRHPNLRMRYGMPGVVPNLTAEAFAGVWLDFYPGWSVRMLHPHMNMPDYGRDLATKVGSALLSLVMHDPQDSTDLLVNFVQFGIDTYGIYLNGGSWQGNGGHGSGRLAPVLFAGLALNRADMASVDPLRFGEGQQTFFVEMLNGLVNGGHGNYSTQNLGMPEWGMYHATQPASDTVVWNTEYRVCCTANAWVAQVLALRLLGIARHAPWESYVERYLAIQRAAGAPAWQLHWDQPWHLVAHDQFRSEEMPGVRSIGCSGMSTYAEGPDLSIHSTTPAHQGGVFRLEVMSRIPKAEKALLFFGNLLPMPTKTSTVPGITLANWLHISPVGDPLVVDLVPGTGLPSVVDIPVPAGIAPGTTVALQCFVLESSGYWKGSNALEVRVLPPDQS